MLNAVTYILGNDTTVQNLVGSKTVDGLESYHKIYPVVAPSEEKDSYCVCRISGKAEISKGCNTYEYLIDVASYATNYDKITILNSAVISALTNQASGTVNGVDFSYLNFVNESDGYDVDRRLFYKVTTFNGISN